jgi:lysophospholipase L1-like esterase
MISLYHLVDRVSGVDTSVGYGVAIWNDVSLQDAPSQPFVPQTMASGKALDPSNPYLLWPAAIGPQFATGLLTSGGYLYAYGCKTALLRCSLARVSITNSAAVTDPSQWQFFSPGSENGCMPGTWTNDMSCATPLPAQDDGSGSSPGNVQMQGGAAGMSVFFDAYLGEYVEVYTEPNRNNILYRVAYAPEGPWSAPGLIAQGKQPRVSNLGEPYHCCEYASYVHPEFAKADGKTEYITYYRSTDVGTSTAEFDLIKVDFGLSPATHSRAANKWSYTTAESYFGQSGDTLTVESSGPTSLATSPYSNGIDAANADEHGVIYDPNSVDAGGSVVARLDSQSDGGNGSVAGILIRNRLATNHQSPGTKRDPNGQGYVALVRAPDGRLTLRWDADGDEVLDSESAPATVQTPVWLKLVRTGSTTYSGSYSTDSSSGSDGSWTSLGTATVSTARAQQDAGLFASGPDPTHLEAATFSSFETHRWVASWSTPVSLDTSSSADVGGNTFRNMVRTSIGGGTVRVRLSNAFGTAPLQVGSASLGRPDPAGGPNLISGSIAGLTFDGSSNVTIPVGEEVVSDPLSIAVTESEDLSVNLYLTGSVTSHTWHRAAMGNNSPVRKAAYEFAGDQTVNATAGGSIALGAWYFVDGIDVEDPTAAGTVVTYGDSITAGYGTSVGHTYPDDLFATVRSVEPASGATFGVVNQGLVGLTLNQAVTSTVGGVPRYVADVENQPGVRAVIVNLGVNDLDSVTTSDDPNAVSNVMIYELNAIAAQFHSDGIRVIGTTITPLGVHANSVNEQVRNEVNSWIRATGSFDVIFDFDQALTDGLDPASIQSSLASATGSVHPNYLGYLAMANLFNGRLGEVMPANT